jgi:hypothetical protein
MSTVSIWMYRDSVATVNDLVGYDVEATDGSIGKIDDASRETGRQYLVVDTGFWIFGKKRLIPAGVVQRVDADDRKVYVSMTKDQIKQAPDHDAKSFGKADRDYDAHAGYYRDYF